MTDPIKFSETTLNTLPLSSDQLIFINDPGGTPEVQKVAISSLAENMPSIDLNTGKNLELYNTADKVTDFERFYQKWDSNVFKIGTEKGGSGTLRNIIFDSLAHVGFGNSASNYIGWARGPFAVTETISATPTPAYVAGIWCSPYFTTDTSMVRVYGYGGTVRVDGSVAPDVITGLIASAMIFPTANLTYPLIHGANSLLIIGGPSTFTEGYSLLASLTASEANGTDIATIGTYWYQDTSGTITRGYGLHIDAPEIIQAAACTTLYGIYIHDQTHAQVGTAYNLYSAGVNAINKFEGTIDSGTLTSFVPILTTATARTLSASEVKGHFLTVTSSATISLPTVVIGSVITVYSTVASAVIVDPLSGDRIILDGTAGGDGKQITSANGAGDFVTLIGDSADGWMVIGRSGTWTMES